MSESVIFNSPILIVLYGIALAVTLFEKRNRTNAVLSWAAAILVLGTSGFAMILGASYLETAAVVVLFLMIQLMRPKELT